VVVNNGLVVDDIGLPELVNGVVVVHIGLHVVDNVLVVVDK